MNYRTVAIAAALLMPVVIDGGLIAAAIPEVLIAEQKLGLDDIERLTKEAEEAEEPEKNDSGKEKTEMPDIQTDLLELKIGKAIYKDYSKGTPPKEKVYNVKIDERDENITNPQSFVRLIIFKALKDTKWNFRNSQENS